MNPTESLQTPPAVAAVVLAAGKSTRMRSRLPKTLHPICGTPLLAHILQTLTDAGVARRVVVVGHQAETVQGAMDAHFGAGALEYVLQSEQKGTGHAAQMAEPLLHDTPTVLVLPGDAPLLSPEILTQLIATHYAERAAATILSAVLSDAGAYGRIVRDESGGDVLGIVEAKDATPEQQQIREINAGVYAFDGPCLFAALRNLRTDNAQGELYLTDVVAMLKNGGGRVRAVVSPDADVTLGVNTRVELAEIGQKMRQTISRRHMLAGITIEDPQTTYIDAGVTIGQDTTIRPNTHITGATHIGEACTIGPNSVVQNARVANHVSIVASFVEDAEIGEGVKIGPMARIRPGTMLAAGVKIGNFVEIKNAHIGETTAVGHLTYIGDATVGANTNIGAGTITCNYDGFAKHKTTIGDGVFVGSHTTLVAPVTVENGAVTGAGSVIIETVPADALAIARERQMNKPDWARSRRERYADIIAAAAQTETDPTETKPSSKAQG